MKFFHVDPGGKRCTLRSSQAQVDYVCVCGGFSTASPMGRDQPTAVGVDGGRRVCMCLRAQVRWCLAQTTGALVANSARFSAHSAKALRYDMSERLVTCGYLCEKRSLKT